MNGGVLNESIEKRLSPDDWRLKEILKFRHRVDEAEHHRVIHDIEAIRDELAKKKIPTEEDRIIYLYQNGMGCQKIARILNVSKNDVYPVVNAYRKNNQRVERSTQSYTDVLAFIKAK